MNASKLANGSEAEVLDKTSQTPPKSAQRMRRGLQPKRSARKLLDKRQNVPR
jgi:hypothetical protein